jgi:hypothetical protein
MDSFTIYGNSTSIYGQGYSIYGILANGGGGGGVATTVGVLASPSPTTTTFSIVGSVLQGEYVPIVGRTLGWAAGATNAGYTGTITGAQVSASVVQITCHPAMASPPSTGDIPLVT